MSLKNILIFVLVLFSKLFKMRPFLRLDPQAPRILIISTTGLGDTLWGTPAIKAIKETYPRSFLAVLTSGIGKALLTENPHIDKLFTISHRCLLELPFLFKALRKERFDTVLVFHLSQRPTLPLCYFAKPSLIIGSEGINKGLDFLLTVKLPRKHQHEIQRRLDIVNQIGATTQQPLLEIFVNQKEKTTAKAFVESLPENSMLIALHPGSKDAFKQWAPSAFIALGQKLQKELHAHLLITGNSEEHALAQHISDAIPFSINIAGKFSIRELAALFPYLAVLVTNDTGPMHLGFATKTPTVALFSATDPHLCGPFAAKDAIVLYQKKTCHPCLGKSCRDAFCMLQHSPRDVFNHILTLLNLKKISGAAS